MVLNFNDVFDILDDFLEDVYKSLNETLGYAL